MRHSSSSAVSISGAYQCRAAARFYAGHPVEGANGEPIGTLCVFDPSPRDAISVDEVLLRALALQVQELLRMPAAGVGTRA